MARALDVDVGSVTVGEFLDLGDGVLLADVDHQISAALESKIKFVLSHVQADDEPGVLGLGAGDHAEPDRTTAGDDHDIVELDVGALHRVQSAGERLGECGVRRRQSAETLCTRASLE